nr:unnamed protein product [Digitaria exilis]
MEVVEGMMERMKLSAAERKGIRVQVTFLDQPNPSGPQAISKALAEKLVSEEGLKQTLGRICYGRWSRAASGETAQRLRGSSEWRDGAAAARPERATRLRTASMRLKRDMVVAGGGCLIQLGLAPYVANGGGYATPTSTDVV